MGAGRVGAGQRLVGSRHRIIGLRGETSRLREQRMVRSATVGARPIRVTDIGWRALVLFAGGRQASARPLAALSRSLYLDIAGDVVWLGPPGSTLHARAMIADTALDDGSGDAVPQIEISLARVWRPPALPTGIARDAMARAAADLARTASGLDRPEGFGALLAGARPSFPLERAVDDVTAFLAACAAGEASMAASKAERLLGLGPGLTPAGDDLVGGAFFARRILAEAGVEDDVAAWRAAAETIRARAEGRTHRISAALLGDLVDGHGYAPLHELAVALACGNASLARDAVARLISIGHSSGWDLLAGFLGALGALPD